MMKTTLKNLTAGAFALAVCVPFATAEPGEGEKKGPKGDRPARGERGGGPRGERPDFKAMLEKYDEDKDGKLSVDERETLIKARLKENERFAEMFTKRADENGDGELSDAEIKTAVEKMGQRRQRGPRGAGEGREGRGRRGGGEKPKADAE